MTRRQPSLSEAKRLIEMGRLGHYWIVFKPKMRSRDWFCYEADPIASDITERCFGCSKVIVDKRDNFNNQSNNCTCRENLIRGRWKTHKCNCPPWSARFCISCGNKRRPLIKAAWEWNENRYFINKVERLLYEHRKNSRPITRASIVNDGRRKEQQTGV